MIGGEDLYQAVCRACYIILQESALENNGIEPKTKLNKHSNAIIETKIPLKEVNTVESIMLN